MVYPHTNNDCRHIIHNQMWIFSRYWRYSGRIYLCVKSRHFRLSAAANLHSNFIEVEWFKNSASYEDPQYTSIKNVNLPSQCEAEFLDDLAQFSPVRFSCGHLPTHSSSEERRPNCAKFGKDTGPSSKLNKIPLYLKYLAPFGKEDGSKVTMIQN